MQEIPILWGDEPGGKEMKKEKKEPNKEGKVKSLDCQIFFDQSQ